MKKTFTSACWIAWLSVQLAPAAELVVDKIVAGGSASPALSGAKLLFSDYFDTNPFEKASPRWSVVKFYHYGFYWSGFGWDPVHDANLGGAAAGLPASDGNTLVAFSTGHIELLGNAPLKLPAKGELSFDFCIRHRAKPEGTVVMAQQFVTQPDQQAVSVSFQVNPAGQMAWKGGGTPEHPQTLQPGVWYSFTTRVTKTNGVLSLESEIHRAADGSLIARAPLRSETVPGAVPETFKPGIQLDLSPEGYWSRLVEIDNVTFFEN
ncbi:MAG: hypothetical protein WCH98_10375 [Verrucomicrobiota bacterium]|jgi:hypothetical protein